MKKKLFAGLALILVVLVALFVAFPGLILKLQIDRIRSASGLSEKSVSIGDHQMAYLEGGQGETVLMVHGFGGNKDNWTRFAEFITPHYHVVIPDMPGFGESTFLDSADYGTTEQAKRLDRFVSALGLDNFHIVGNSMGGNIAGRYAVMYPEKVLSLGLFNAAGVSSPEPSELARIIQDGGNNPLIVNSTEDFDRLMSFVFVKPPYIPDFAKKFLIEEGKKHSAGNKKIFEQLAAERGSLEKDLSKIQAQTLVLWGDKDRVLDVSGARVFADGIEHAQLVIMKDCGHVPMVERPQEAAEHYLKFLKKFGDG